MAEYQIVQHQDNDIDNILVSSTLYNSSDSTINAILPANVAPGSIIHTKGYENVKEKGLDGSWTAI